MTVRALAGLAALNVAYALVGLSLLWGLRAFRTWGRPAPARRARVPARPRRVRRALDGAARRRRPVRRGRDRGVARRSRRGRRRRRPAPRAPPRARSRPSRRHSDRCSSRRPGIALAGLFLEALFRAARLQSLQEYDAWAFWVPKGKAIYFFDGLDAHVFTTTPNASYPPLQPDPRRGGLPRDGRRGRRHVARAVLVPRRRRHRRRRRAAPSARTRLAPLAVRSCSSSSCRASASVCWRLRRDVLLDVLVVVAALLLALWLRDAARLAARRGRGAARRAAQHEARGHPLRGVRARRRRSSSPGRGAGRGSLAASLAVGARRRFPGVSGRRGTTSPSGAPPSFDTGRLAGRVRPLVRRPLLERALVGPARRGDDRTRRRRGLGRSGAWPAYVGLVAVAGSSPAASGRRSASRISRSPPTSRGNPIVRYTGSIVFLAAVALPLLLVVGLARTARSP